MESEVERLQKKSYCYTQFYQTSRAEAEDCRKQTKEVQESFYDAFESRQIANAYDCVCIENLDMKAMSQSLHFGKSVADNGWVCSPHI